MIPPEDKENILRNNALRVFEKLRCEAVLRPLHDGGEYG